MTDVPNGRKDVCDCGTCITIASFMVRDGLVTGDPCRLCRYCSPLDELTRVSEDAGLYETTTPPAVCPDCEGEGIEPCDCKDGQHGYPQPCETCGGTGRKEST